MTRFGKASKLGQDPGGDLGQFDGSEALRRQVGGLVGHEETSDTDAAGGDSGAQPDILDWSPRLGAHLQAFRQQAGLRRVDFARRMGVSEETIRLWEKGAVQPSADCLSRLIAVLSLEAGEWQPPSSTAPDLPPLASALLRERQGRAITQVEAVKLLGVPQATYAGWETGRTVPTPQFLATIAVFLGTSEDEVLALCSSRFVVDTTGWPDFGRLLGSRREALRLTREALASRLGVTPGTVVAWELGYRSPGPPQLRRLAHVLAIDVATLAEALPRGRVRSRLGELILARQRELGLRSTDIAERAGTTEATISRWVHGRNKPAAASLERLALALEIPLAVVADAAGIAA